MKSIPHITLTKQIAFSSNIVILSFDVVISFCIYYILRLVVIGIVSTKKALYLWIESDFHDDYYF